MKVKVHLLSQSNSIECKGVIENTYTKDGLYCIYFIDGTVHKYPLVNIFRITETYEYK